MNVQTIMMPSGKMVSQRARWAAGQPISELMARALAHPHLISLAAGFVDGATLPVEIVRTAAEDLLSDNGAARAALQYGTTSGHPALRERLRQEICQEGAKVPSLEQVIITAGSNQLLHLVAETLFDPGDIVLCAAPTYFVFMGTLANLGVEAIGVETDEQGIIPEALQSTWEQLVSAGREQRVKAIYLVTYFDNPRGVTMPLDRRRRVVEWAKRQTERLPPGQRIHVLADEAYRQLRYAGDDVPSTLVLDEERDTVIMAGTFSKSFSPGIRVGWGIMPQDLIEPLCNQKGNIDFGSPNFNQHLMERVFERGLFASHVQGLRAAYGEKLRAMLGAMDKHLSDVEGVDWDQPAGGLYVWLRLPQGMDAGPGGHLFDLAVQRGVLYVPGEYCFAPRGAPVQKHSLRLSFGVQSCDNLREGIRVLALAIRQLLDESCRRPPRAQA